MKTAVLLILWTTLLLWGCSSAPRQELQTTKITLAQAIAAGAPELAPTEFASARSAVLDAERLIGRRKYKLASEALALSRAHARRAIAISEEEAALQEEEQVITEKPVPPPRKKAKKAAKSVKAAPQPKEQAIEQAVPVPVLMHYSVAEKDTLWLIAARQDVYGNPLLWPLLYRANRDQIRDPRQIHAGQILDIPRNISANERKDAIERARTSDIFPVEILLHNPSTRP
jgi:nucleoid-associated protein YgaU